MTRSIRSGPDDLEAIPRSSRRERPLGHRARGGAESHLSGMLAIVRGCSFGAGVGFVPTAAWLLPATAAVPLAAIAAVGARSGQRAAMIGVAGSALILVGKFRVESPVAVYLGMALLVAASLLSWRRREPAAACSACANEHHEGR